MALPVVAIIGRPNVGKSTLVNRLCRSREAIVHDQPGVTRDRSYQEGFWGDRTFLVVDTGGLVFDDDSEFLPEIREQANLALAEAAVALVIVDGQQGVMAADESIAAWLRGQGVPALLAVNKCESPDQGLAMAAEFWSLGLGEPHPISAIHGAGTGDLLDRVVSFLPPTAEGEEPEPIQLAIIGRPNVGKSSLLNAVCGENRAIVSPIRGTTRDTIDTTITQDGQTWKLVDTAGIRRRRSVDYGPEYFGINRSFKAIERSDVCVLVIDALDGVTEQDQRLAGRIEEEGRACVVVVNKWDAIEKDSHTMPSMEKELRAKLYFLDWAPMVFVSALSGQRVTAMFPLASLAVEQHRRRVSTSVVNEVLQEALRWRSPPTSRGGRQGRLYYGTQVASRPPSFTLFVNEPRLFGETYRRYVERQIREGLGFEGSPIRLFWRGKQQRDAEKDLARQHSTRVAEDAMDWLRQVPIGQYLDEGGAQKRQLAAAAGSPAQAGLDPGVPDDAGAGRTRLADFPGGSAAAAHLPEWIAPADLATGVAPAVGPGPAGGSAGLVPAGRWRRLPPACNVPPAKSCWFPPPQAAPPPSVPVCAGT